MVVFFPSLHCNNTNSSGMSRCCRESEQEKCGHYFAESHYKQTVENNLSHVSSFHCLHSIELKNPEILSNMITNEKVIQYNL